VRNDFATADKAKRNSDVSHVKEWIECTARMGAPVARVFAGPEPAGHSWDEVSEWMADNLRQCVEYGKQYGVLVWVQNHGDTLKTAEDVLMIAKMVDSDWFGVIVDTGYFLSKDPSKDIARVLPYAVNWQIKEKLDGAAGSRKTELRKLVGIIQQGATAAISLSRHSPSAASLMTPRRAPCNCWGASEGARAGVNECGARCPT
jgi:hypothetical protein